MSSQIDLTRIFIYATMTKTWLWFDIYNDDFFSIVPLYRIAFGFLVRFFFCCLCRWSMIHDVVEDFIFIFWLIIIIMFQYDSIIDTHTHMFYYYCHCCCCGSRIKFDVYVCVYMTMTVVLVVVVFFCSCQSSDQIHTDRQTHKNNNEKALDWYVILDLIIYCEIGKKNFFFVILKNLIDLMDYFATKKNQNQKWKRITHTHTHRIDSAATTTTADDYDDIQYLLCVCVCVSPLNLWKMEKKQSKNDRLFFFCFIFAQLSC